MYYFVSAFVQPAYAVLIWTSR